ncbi:complement regulator-acquiring protein [Borreliella lanei]|uniref:Uncharacterized membrane protein YheB (UPF0754 family) n=1 Tax=Borreliella lanei TaxID=373540 RepID=A0A7X0DK34_9SPIR|nr:complement regulator-acquiring protein [Borreliella lanei]MBB6208526.1 uncharacterized membrane protein YheB (UPF0754 family) [Borreliella lanei]MBB6208533.1 uncharacterized membrane protein YheB (UPF0754 family) [Borreliella lanei]WKC85863.1 complement regulator-acquiring protein [Borreliella lanei]
MTKNKLNKIKLNIIATILTLICISCAVNPIDPKVNSRTDIKENVEKSGNPESLKQKSQEETIVSKLEALGKKLETQKNQEIAKIAEIKESDLIDTLASEIKPFFFNTATEKTKTNVKMQIKRIIYSSLNYDKDKINNLKEILETLKDREDHKDIAIRFLYMTTLNIQEQLDNHLELIKKDKLNNLSEKELQELLIHVEFDLLLKEKFKKTLEKTVNEVYQEIQNKYFAEKSKEYGLSKEQIENFEKTIKTNYVVGHIIENYQIFDYSVKNAESKQKKLNELKAII